MKKYRLFRSLLALALAAGLTLPHRSRRAERPSRGHAGGGHAKGAGGEPTAQ